MRCISMKNSGGAAREWDALVGALMLWRCAALRRIESSIAQGLGEDHNSGAGLRPAPGLWSRAYWATKPPSITSSAPVTYLDSSEAR